MSNPLDHMSDSAKYAIDALSIVTVLGALVQLLPSIAAILTIIWTGIRIIETETVRGLISKWRRDDGTS